MPHIREARESKRLSQAELARRIGRTQAYVAFLEQGRTKRPRYEDVKALARELDCEPDELSFGPPSESDAAARGSHHQFRDETGGEGR